MLATILGSAGALTLLGISDSLLGLFAGRILGGIFGANISVATAYVADATHEDERTRWMGMVGACYGIGFVLGPALGGLLAPNLDGSWPASAVFGATLSAYIEPFGYGIPMLLAAVMAAINFVFAFWVLAEPDRHASRDPGAGRLEVLRNPAVRRLCTINLIFSLAVTQLETVFAYFMIDRFRFDAINVAFILVGMAVLMVGIQGGAIRPLAARFGERKLSLAGFALMAVSLLAVPFMPTVGWTLLPLALSAIGRGIGQPPILSLVSMTASASERGSVLGTFQSSASLARVLGPATAGTLYALYQAGPFVLAATLLFVAWLIVIGLPKGRGSQAI
jgi:MFS family permease